MDAEQPHHLERFRGRPEIKAALLREGPTPSSTEARFERASKNSAYWPAILALSSRFLAAGRSEAVQEPLEVYGRPCWLLSAILGSGGGPFAIAVTAADGASIETLRDLLLDVSHDYWFGSYFWK